jgi:hypothetical protein
MSSEPRPELERLAISASGFVFDPLTGATFTLNATGRALVEGLRDGLGLDDLIDRLKERFDADHADLHRDVLEFVRALQEQALLPNNFDLR